MSKLPTGEIHVIKGLDAVADAFAGTVYSDVINLAEWGAALGIIHKGVGATGTATITVEACDDAAGNNPAAITFNYQAQTSGDTPGDVTAATTSGFATTAGSSQIYKIWIDPQQLPAGQSWVRIKSVEVVDDPVLGGMLLLGLKPRYARHVPNTAIA